MNKLILITMSLMMLSCAGDTSDEPDTASDQTENNKPVVLPTVQLSGERVSFAVPLNDGLDHNNPVVIAYDATNGNATCGTGGNKGITSTTNTSFTIDTACLAEYTLFVVNGYVADKPTIRGVFQRQDILDGTANITLLTEVVVGLAGANVLSDVQGAAQTLNLVAAQLITQDINGDSQINYADVLDWTPGSGLTSFRFDMGEILSDLQTDHQASNAIAAMTHGQLAQLATSPNLTDYRYPTHIITHNDMAYVMTTYGHVLFIDVSNPSEPSLINSLKLDATGSAINGLFVENNRLFVANSIQGVVIIDPDMANDFATPSIVNVIDKDTFSVGSDGVAVNTATDITVIGTDAYIALGGGGLVKVDISDINAPSVSDFTTVPVNKFKVMGNRIYAVYGGGFQIYDMDTLASVSSAVAMERDGFLNAVSIDVKDNYVYIASVDSGVQVVDITNESVPVLVNRVASLSSARALSVKVSGDHLYVADDSGEVQAMDISNGVPASAYRIASYSTQPAKDIAIHNGTLVVAQWSDGLSLIDLAEAVPIVGYNKIPFTNNENIEYRKNTVSILPEETPNDIVNNTKAVDINGNDACLAQTFDGLSIYNIQDVDNITLAGTFAGTYTTDVICEDEYAFISDGHSLKVIDIRDKQNLFKVAEVETAFIARRLIKMGGYLLVSGGFDGTYVFDVTLPSKPLLMARISTHGDVDSIGFDSDNMYIHEADDQLPTTYVAPAILTPVENP